MFELFTREWRGARQQLVQKHAETVDIGPCVDVASIELGLLGTHVFQRADDAAEARCQGPLGQSLAERLGDAEVDDLGYGLAVIRGDQHVRWFDIAMNHALLVGVLHRRTDGRDQYESRSRGESWCSSQYPGDGHPFDQFHHEIRPPRVGRSPVEHTSDVRMFHDGLGLTLGFEAGHDLACVHARLDDFHRNHAANGLLLLGDENDAKATLADLLDEFVGADLRAGGLVGDRGDELPPALFSGWPVTGSKPSIVIEFTTLRSAAVVPPMTLSGEPRMWMSVYAWSSRARVPVTSVPRKLPAMTLPPPPLISIAWPPIGLPWASVPV